MPNEVQFTPHLVSFYAKINLDYFNKDVNNKWYCKQVKVDTKDPYDKTKVNRGITTSQTSASLIFYDEEQNNLFSKLPSDDKYPYGFIWNIDNHTNDECIFCNTDGHIVDYDFNDQKNFKNINVDGINNVSKKYKTDLILMIYRGNTENIMKFARQQTIDLAKKVYDELNSKLSPNDKINKQKLDNVMNKMNEKSYHWIIHSNLEQVGGKWCSKYSLYEALNGDRDKLSATNIVFHSSTKQMSFNMYNEIAIRSNNSRMYFNNLCVNIEVMNESLKENHKNIKDNIENFKSFIDACLKTGSKDIVIFRNKKEEELANNANDKFWLKSSPLIKEKIKFLEFIDTYCEKFKQYFTEEQRQKIEELRNGKEKQEEQNKQKLAEETKLDNQQSQSMSPEKLNAENKNNNVSLFGLGCYQTTNEEKNNSSCGCLFW